MFWPCARTGKEFGVTRAGSSSVGTFRTKEQGEGNSARRWMKCLRRFKLQALTFCDVEIMSTRTAVGQFKGQFKGALERYNMRGFD